MTPDVDWVVIGAGVVGLAVGRAIALAGQSVLVLEQHDHVGSETSSRNSGVIHAGIYYPPGSLKARSCVAGRNLLYQYLKERGLPHERVGKLIVASGEEGVADLHKLQARAEANGVEGLEWLSAEEARGLEPVVECDAALHSPVSGIVDVHQLLVALQGDLEAAGGTVALRVAVKRVEPLAGGRCWRLETNQGLLHSVGVVNCAGLSAVALLSALSDQAPARVYPCLGQYFRYSGRAPFSRLVYPLPSRGGLGIHATPDLAGVVRFGPDVRWQDDFEYRLDPDARSAFAAAIRTYFPEVEEQRLVPDYSGIRPKLTGPDEAPADFRLEGPGEVGDRLGGLISLLGIESPGLTASLALAEEVRDRALRWSPTQ